MQNIKIYWREIIIVVLLLIVLSMSTCNKKTDTKITTKEVVVKTPVIFGEFNKPKDQSELPSKSRDSIIYKDKIVYIESKVEKETVDSYIQAETSLDRLEVLLDATREREYHTDFSDDNIDIFLTTFVQGKLLSQKPKYKIKEKAITVKETTVTNTIVKVDKFGFIIGGGASQGILSNNLNYEAVAGIRLGKVTVLGSVDSNINVGAKLLYEF